MRKEDYTIFDGDTGEIDFLKGLKLAVVCILALFAISTVAWGFATVFHTATAPARMASDTVDRLADTDRAFSEYHWFNDTYNDIQATRVKISNARDQVKDFEASHKAGLTDTQEMEHSNLETNVLGAQNYLQTIIAEYNSKSSSWDKALFKARSLPYSVNIDGKDQF